MRTSQPIQLSLRDYLILEILVLKVTLVTDNHSLYFIMRIVFDFKQPLIEVLETIMLSQIKNQKSSNRTLVIRTSNRFERLLSCLHQSIYTVSQIWILTLRLSILMFLDPNYTPSVGSWSVLNLPSVNLSKRQLLPTPEWMMDYWNHRWWWTWTWSRNCLPSSVYNNCIL